MRRARRLAAGLFCLVALGAGLTACSDQPAVCDDVDALRTSVDNLQDVTVGEDGLSVLTTELENIQSDLRRLGEDAGEEYSSQIGGVRAAVAALESSLEAASASPSAAALAEVADDVTAVGTAVGDLSDAVADTC